MTRQSMTSSLFIFFLIVLLSWLQPVSIQAQEVNLDVPFVPTPYEVVDEMLRLAELKKGDILYDLGCGDGRIVIEAAKRAGIRAVGIDIDPERIRESEENAIKAGVQKMVEFRCQNIFEADFSDATVVTMYLLPDVNIRLRPTILRKLRPGTRIVSHSFDMDEWEPEKHTYVAASLYPHSVYLWIVPANISGIWEWKMNLKQKKTGCRLEIEQHFQKYSGQLILGDEKIPLPEGKVNGDLIDLVVTPASLKDTTLRFTGRAIKDIIKGEIQVVSGPKNSKESWEARRRPGTAREIDS
ncbi:MAG TPA: class I SAM-dependent methyltransferase [Candidatus Saccharicenans sp.]|nr:class I SAM-dependent methyltransferase [Candidatus Saccharicenans sp.]HNT00876.1 class I SAM-dependent methyltransferase [Candidatus Saccharicenans sp.]